MNTWSVQWLAVLLVMSGVWTGRGESWTLNNPTGIDYQGELVRLKLKVPPGDFHVTAEGQPVPFQVDRSREPAELWVRVDLAAGASRAFTVVSGTKPAPAPLVGVRTNGAWLELNNGLVAIRLPATREEADIPAPLVQFSGDGGKTWKGKGAWVTARTLKNFTATVTGDGALFGQVRLDYEFDGPAGLDGDKPAKASVEIRLQPGKRFVEIWEQHQMGRADGWNFDLAAGWSPKESLYKPHGSGAGVGHDEGMRTGTLLPGQSRMGEVLIHLIPRWNQGFDDGWFFAASDGTDAVGALVARAGRWVWPHDNALSVVLGQEGRSAVLKASTRHGSRYWMLVMDTKENLLAPVGRRDGISALVEREAFQPLDKIVHDYITEWPGRKGRFQGFFFFSTDVNPTGHWRQLLRQAISQAGKPGDIGTLTLAQVILDPDAYGSYRNYWSPQNPNFYTDFTGRGIALVSQLKDHPQFELLRSRAEQILREDMDHSITLPGGAGQECPGYQRHAMGVYANLAKVCREHLGFDPTTWERYQEGEKFFLRSSQPDGDKRRLHPGGDTHPIAGGPPFIQGDVSSFKTEELPGFGVIFRNRPGTSEETYLAFKSGPNRGHYHGDQLSFHYCAHARPVAVDHYCSYKPRAGQEHMHNRVSFHTPTLPYANMDGYERVLALKTSDEADIAVGQVESNRLRVTTPLPPEEWDVEFPQERFDGTPLIYRRTIVAVKNGREGDYFVIRDQSAGPKVGATYNLHVRGTSVKRDGSRFDFGSMTLFCAAPAEFGYAELPWSHENGSKEETIGVRLTQKGDRHEFITVLHPGKPKAVLTAVPGGVKVGDDEIVFAGGLDVEAGVSVVTVRRAGRDILVLKGADIDFNRSQGDIGLFVPDAGYPFGEIPDWLIRQRAR